MFIQSRRKLLIKISAFLLSSFFNFSCKSKVIEAGRIAIGSADDFKESVNNLDLFRLVIFREVANDKIIFRAMSKLCTHQSCLLGKDIENYHCPCHGSVFSNLGKVLKGPAVRNLPFYKLSIDSSGQIIVDFNDVVDHNWFLTT